MKILGISLLRLGDLILQRSLIEGLRKKHPQGEVHLLINKQFAQVEFLFAGLVDKFVYFDRELLQKSCGEKEFNILWGVKALQGLVTGLNEENYDSVYNFTHNRLTAHIAGLIKASSHVGIYSRDGIFLGLETPWIQFFNRYFGTAEAAGFHYTEILGKALDIPFDVASRRSVHGARKNLILMQPLTSDVKKNWHLQRYAQLSQALKEETSFEVKILGAPFEKEILLKYFTEEQLFICDLEQATEQLKNTELLVTGDTSIKHLAALFDVPILEISLGSSQPLQVGAYSNDAIILQPRVACGPCPHSLPCSQKTHACGERLGVSTVLRAIQICLKPGQQNWNDFTNENPDVDVYRTEIRPHVGWIVEALSSTQKNKFNEILQRKTMIVEELDRRQSALHKGVANERTGKLSQRGIEAPGKGL